MGCEFVMPRTYPKPLVQIGYRPVIWHVMKYYAHFGHKDFILCLGYGADQIKKYFLDYSECVSNDFVLSLRRQEGRALSQRHSRLADHFRGYRNQLEYRTETEVCREIPRRRRRVSWRITAMVSQIFRFHRQLENFRRQDRIASFLCVLPNLSYHVVSTEPGTGLVSGVQPIRNGSVRINGGYFIFRKEIFDYMRAGEELVIEPFQTTDRREATHRLSIRWILGLAWTHSKTSRNSKVSGDLVLRLGKSGKRTATKTEPANRSLPFRLQSFWIAGKQTEMGSLDAQDREYLICISIVSGLRVRCLST